jgi:hypothetical protein
LAALAFMLVWSASLLCLPWFGSKLQKRGPPTREGLSAFVTALLEVSILRTYFGGCGVNTSRRLGSGFGLGFGAFLTSFLPLSLLPMTESMT